jgi:plastocyanin
VRTRAAIVLILTVAVAALLPPARAGAGGFCMGYTASERFTDTDGNGVSMHNNCFSPTIVRVEAGDTVTFVNKDKDVHAVGGAVGSFGDPHAEIAPGESVRYRFDVEGTFPYVCIYHPGMAGAVVVGDGEGPAFKSGGIAEVSSTDEPNDSSGGTAGATTEARSAVEGSTRGDGWLALLALAVVISAGATSLLIARRRRAGNAPVTSV